jgi:hypothetical protein
VRPVGAAAAGDEVDRDGTLVLVGRLRERLGVPGLVAPEAPVPAEVTALIDALAARRDPAVVDVLVEALFALPGARERICTALVAQGAAAIPELRRVLRGEHATVNARIAMRVPASTEREELASLVLAELHADDATADLVAALERTPAATPAILRALAQIGDPEADDAVHRVWADRRSPYRALALDAYGYVARDAEAMPELWRLAADKRLRDQVLDTIGRVAESDVDLAKLRKLQRAARTRWRAAHRRVQTSAAMGELESAASEVERSLVVRVDGVMRAAPDRFEAAERRRQRAIAALEPLEAASHAALDELRHLDRQIARVELAWRCRRRVACLVASLSTPQDAVADSLGLVSDAELGDELDHRDDRPLALAQIDRAMLELAKHAELPHARKTGDVAPAAAVLRAALSCKPAMDCYSDDAGVREAILRALAWIEKPAP